MQSISRKLRFVLFVFVSLASVSATWAQEKSSTAESIWGSRYKASQQVRVQQQTSFRHGTTSLQRLLRWNAIAIDASGLDHTPVAPGENRVFGEQLGPGRAARAIAIVHIAIFDAVNAIDNEFESYSGIPKVRESTSVDSAIAQAAHDTLVAMFPSQANSFHQLLKDDLHNIPGGRAKQNGIDLGRRSAAAILALRNGDGSNVAEERMGIEYIPGDEAGVWRQDPISLIPIALGSRWSEVTPFVMNSASQFRTPPPPAMTSNAYRSAFNEVKRLGGDGIVTPTSRTDDQTTIGIYWAYDGTPSLCAPPRLYNQIAVEIADVRNTTEVIDMARLLALVNTAMADSGIAIWESKFFYKFWRPIGGIRESDPGTGPTGTGDGNPATKGDPFYSPLGAPASNLQGPNFTPPFPAYPSGHAGFGGALFQALRRFYRTDRIRFKFISDEFNGITEDNQGNVRPLIERSFRNLSEAEEENGQSRIYLGIHWRFDKTEGIAQGRRVADFVFDHAFRRRN